MFKTQRKSHGLTCRNRNIMNYLHKLLDNLNGIAKDGKGKHGNIFKIPIDCFVKEMSPGINVTGLDKILNVCRFIVESSYSKF